MEKRIKNITIGIIIGCMLMTTPVLADSIMQKIDVVLNGVGVQIDGKKLDAPSILYNGTTYLPMRVVAEAVGKEIEWNQSTMTANIVEVKDVENTLPTIIDYGFENDNYIVTFSDGFTVAASANKNLIPNFPYESVIVSAYIKNMDKSSIISMPKIIGFNELYGYKYDYIEYDVYIDLIPEEYKEGFKEMDFYKKFNLRANDDSFGGTLYYESSSYLDGVNYDDGIHKCNLYFKDKN